MDSDATKGPPVRLTGLLYLLYFVAGAPLMLRSSLVVPGDAAATADRIVRSAQLYRLTVVTDLASYVLYIGLAYLFYRLLRGVSRPWALVASLFTVAGCIVLISVTCLLAAPLALLTGDALAGLSLAERQQLAMLSLKIYQQGFISALLLFGAQWLIMGPLFARSGLTWRPIAYILTIGGAGWFAFAVASIVAPPLGMAMQVIVLPVGGLGEVALALSLLFRRSSAPVTRSGDPQTQTAT